MVDQQQYMQLCSCHSGEKVMFQCIDKACPNHHTQLLYCIRCMIPSKHNHVPGAILIQNENLSGQWNKLRSDMSTILEVISEWLMTHGELVSVLDSHIANSKQTFTAKVLEMRQLQ